MEELVIAEARSSNWTLTPTSLLFIDRARTTRVKDYLESQRVIWLHDSDDRHADVRLYKPGATGMRPVPLLREAAAMRPFDRSALTLLGEPRELSPLGYLLAKKNACLAVAPGDDLRRICYASEWIDPQLDDWRSRRDRICWIARPTPERVAMARTLHQLGVPLDLYSRQQWPTEGWLGYCDNELETARLYRYRIACENFLTHGYHSEKLFYGIRSGCVTFYLADAGLRLPCVEGAFISYSVENICAREELAAKTLEGIEKFLFSERWEMYSYRAFYDAVVSMARRIVDCRESRA